MALETVESTIGAADVAELLRRDGALVVRDVLHADEVERVNRETAALDRRHP